MQLQKNIYINLVSFFYRHLCFLTVQQHGLMTIRFCSGTNVKTHTHNMLLVILQGTAILCACCDLCIMCYKI